MAYDWSYLEPSLEQYRSGTQSTPEEEQVDGGLVSSLKSTVGSGIKGLGQLAADFIPGVTTDNPVYQYGQEIIEENPTRVHSLSDLASNPFTGLSEIIGNVAPTMGAIVGSKVVGSALTAASPLAGPAAPIVAGVGQVISWLGPYASAMLPSYSSIRDKQIFNDPVAQDSAKEKIKAVIGASTVAVIENKFGPQDWVGSLVTKEGRNVLANKFASTSVGGRILEAGSKGGTIESLEELVQSPVEQFMSNDDFLSKESLEDTGFGAVSGLIGGGVMGGGVGLLSKQNKPKTEDTPKPEPKPWQETLEDIRKTKEVILEKPEVILASAGIDTSQDVKDPMTGDIFKNLFDEEAKRNRTVSIQIDPITGIPSRDIPVADTSGSVPLWRKREASDNLNALMDSQVQQYQENQLTPPGMPAPSSPIVSPTQPTSLVRDISQDTSTTRPLWDTPEARRRITAANEIDRFFPPGRYGQIQGALFAPDGEVVDVSGQSVQEAVSTAIGKKVEAVEKAKKKVQKTTNMKDKEAARQSLIAAQQDLSVAKKEATVLAEQTGATVDLSKTPTLAKEVTKNLSPETKKTLAATKEKLGPTESQKQQVQEQTDIANTIEETTKGKKVPAGWTTSTAKVEGKEKTIYTKGTARGIKVNDKNYLLADMEDGEIVRYGTFKSVKDMDAALSAKQTADEFYKKAEKAAKKEEAKALSIDQLKLVASLNLDKVVGVAQRATGTLDNNEAYDIAIDGIQTAARTFKPDRGVKFETHATNRAKYAINTYKKTVGQTSSLDASSKASEGSERDSKVSQVTKEQIEDAVPLKETKKTEKAPPASEVKKVVVSKEEEANILKRVQAKGTQKPKEIDTNRKTRLTSIRDIVSSLPDGASSSDIRKAVKNNFNIIAIDSKRTVLKRLDDLIGKEDISPALQKDLDQIAPEITYQGSSKMLGKDIHQFITKDGRNFSTLSLDPKEIQEKYNKIQEGYKENSPSLLDKPSERVALKKEFLKKATSADKLIRFTELAISSIKDSNVSKSIFELSKYIQDNVKDKLSKIQVRDTKEYTNGSPSETPGAFYHNGVIYLNQSYLSGLKDNALAETIVHEVTHAVTVKEMEANPEIRKKVIDLMENVRREVLTAEEYSLLKNKYNFDPVRITKDRQAFEKDLGRLSAEVYYGLLDEKEFLAQAFSSKQFQEELKRINLEKPKGTIRTLWDKFVSTVREVLGMTNQEMYTALDEALSLGTYLFKTDVSSGRLEVLGARRYASGISPTFFKYLPVDYDKIGLTSTWKENKKILNSLAKSLGFVPHRIENSMYYELDDSKSTIDYDKVKEGTTVYLNDLLDHYQLFETDRTLKGIQVVFTNQDEILLSARKENLRISDDLTKKTILGAAYGRKIYINLKGIEKFKDKENTKLENVLIHEVQHLLDSADNEGVARETQARLSLTKEERAKTKPDFKRYWYQSVFVAEDAISPALEKKKKSVKTWDQRESEISKSTTVSERLKDVGSSFKDLAKDIVQVSSDVLRSIDDRILKPMREFENKIAQSNVSARKQVKEFYDGYKEMSSYDRNLLGLTLYNTDKEAVDKRKEILKKNNLEEAYSKVEKLLKDIHNAKEELGINEFDEIENWFPRRLKPKGLEGLMKAMTGDPEYNTLQAELDNLAKNKTSQEDKEHLIRSIINTGRYPAIAFKKGTSDKQRKIHKISSEWMKFYVNPMEALLSHIYESNEQLAAHSMFSDNKLRYSKVTRKRLLWSKLKDDDKLIGKGKDPKLSDKQREEVIAEIELIEADLNNVEKSFDKLDTLLASIAPELSEPDARSAINVIRARLTQRGMGGPVATVRNISLAAAMGSPTSAITQLTDLALNIWVNGAKNTISAMFGPRLITAQDLDLEHSMREFQTEGSAKWLDKVLTWSGMKYMDLFGKETFIQGAINSAKDLSLEDFSKKWKHYLGEDTEQTYNELQADKNTELTRFFAFNALSDWQPISLLEMPIKYQNAGNYRIFYALKSYNIKQLNNIYRESVISWRKAGTKEEKQRIARRTGSLILFMAIAGASTDELKDFLLGKSANSFTDNFHENLLKIAFMSRYTLNNGFQKGFFETMLKDILIPPVGIIDDPFKDIISWFGDKPDFKTIRNLPWGKLPYEWFSPVAEEKDYSRLKTKITDGVVKKNNNVSNYRKEIRDYNNWATRNKEKPITYSSLMQSKRRYLKDQRE